MREPATERPPYEHKKQHYHVASIPDSSVAVLGSGQQYLLCNVMACLSKSRLVQDNDRAVFAFIRRTRIRNMIPLSRTRFSYMLLS